MVKTAVNIEHEELISSFVFLDELRKSGKTNMVGAGVYIRNEFGYSHPKCREILSMWIRTYDPEKTMNQRIDEAFK